MNTAYTDWHKGGGPSASADDHTQLKKKINNKPEFY